MEEEYEILLPHLLEITEEEAVRATPYELSVTAMNDLHSRSHEKLAVLFPDGPAYPLVKQINREVEALWESPYAYALMVADDARKYLQKKGIAVALAGAWEKSWYAYLMGMTDRMPAEMAEPSEFVEKPLGLQLPARHMQLCREALLLAAWKHTFYVRSRGERELLLLPPEEDSNPQAPVFQILEKA